MSLAGMAVGVTVLGLTAAPVGASGPAQHERVDVTGDEFTCADGTTYTITSGTVLITVHEGESQGGTGNFTFTITPNHVEAVSSDNGETYSITGAFWVGGSFNSNNESETFTVTDHFQIHRPGEGTVDDVQVTFHANVGDNHFNVKDFDFGTCSSPED